VAAASTTSQMSMPMRSVSMAGGVGVGGGLEHHELPGLQDVGEGARGVHERPEVGLAVGRERGGHADEHGVGLGQARVARGGVDARPHLAQQLRGHVLDVGLAGLDGGDLAGVEVDGDDVAALLREGHHQGQPHVAQPDHADRRHRRQSLEVGAGGV
jgi:hypothetical protein